MAMCMTSSRRLSGHNRNRILIRLLRELEYTTEKSTHLLGWPHLIKAREELLKALIAEKDK